MSLRRSLLALPLLLAAGCAQTPGAAPDRANLSPAGLFAVTVENADETMERAIGRMDAFERLAAREDAAIEYAAGRGTGPAPAFTPGGPGVAEATGRVLAPAFTALGSYGHVLAQIAAGEPVAPRPSPSGAQLAQAMRNGLEMLRGTAGVQPGAAAQEAGLRAVAYLANVPEQLARATGRPALQALVNESQPHVAALAALLQEVVGPTTETGARRAIRARRLALNESQGRFLQMVRADRGVSAAERYAIFRTVSELREGDPAPGTLQQVGTVLETMAAAHGALAQGREDAANRSAGFAAAVDQLATLTQQTRRGEQ